MTPNEAASAGGGGGGHWGGVMTDGYSDYSGRQNNGTQLNLDIKHHCQLANPCSLNGECDQQVLKCRHAPQHMKPNLKTAKWRVVLCVPAVC